MGPKKNLLEAAEIPICHLGLLVNLERDKQGRPFLWPWKISVVGTGKLVIEAAENSVHCPVIPVIVLPDLWISNWKKQPRMHSQPPLWPWKISVIGPGKPCW